MNREFNPWSNAEIVRLSKENAELKILLQNNQVRREEVEANHGELLRENIQAQAKLKLIKRVIEDFETTYELGTTRD